MKRFVIYAFVGVFVVWALRILFPPSSHPEATRRMQCYNNIKQIVLALQNYHDDFGAFPPSYLADEERRPKHSWRVLLLPYLDAKDVYDQYRFEEPWDSPHNISLQDEIPPAFQCPSFVLDHRRQATNTPHFQCLTNYVVISDPSGIFDASNASQISDVTDGTSVTVLVAEVRNHAVHWLKPSDVSLDDIISDLIVSSDDSRANHTGGLLFGMADGSVQFISADTDVDSIRALVTKAGGERRHKF
ncbi:MAG: DUF1559 domain-containing protein [Planctomycetes bacterium]|nr:DUF1559 domain-containing protein [Planctomycetota bacterium]MBL7040132.1 DUF1559 domain-containing protein [Pirellulaceae bacterium]